MYKKSDRRPIKKEDAREVLGGKLFFNLTDIELRTMLDKSLFGFFERCFSIYHVLGKHEYFLRFSERRNQYRYLLKKETHTQKNESLRELLTCIIRKFNGYELLKKRSSKKRKPTFRSNRYSLRTKSWFADASILLFLP